MYKICVLGATGSIGSSTLEVIKQHPDDFELHSFAAFSDSSKMMDIYAFNCNAKMCLFNEDAAQELRKLSGETVLTSMDGLLELVSGDCDIVVNGLTGSVGCLPTLKAIECGKKIALANKETCVMAGELINAALEKNKSASIIPVDSEHSAIFQCLAGRPTSEVERLLITASGGPFRELSAEKFESVKLEDALKHPVWNMGKKITIDSASLMNKGLEVIEAHYLFKIPYEQIKVIVHPQSLVHSMVQFRDGSLMAQMGAPDMKIPIQYALTHPSRMELETDRLDLASIGNLSFMEPDFSKFPCLKLAYSAGESGGSRPAVLNAANEILANMFIEGRIAFTDIPKGIEYCLGKIPETTDALNLEKILEIDFEARNYAKEFAASCSPHK